MHKISRTCREGRGVFASKRPRFGKQRGKIPRERAGVRISKPAKPTKYPRFLDLSRLLCWECE
ncbi:uncharacterized protein [Bemisia tabaci]|uniref:uncharacterized protein n=1 Tax=Bemisia tabaci TaxID=7038 RepID=UPI003B28B2A4